MIAQSSLVGTSGVVVLNPIADEVADMPRLELDHHLDADFSVGRDHQRAHVIAEFQEFRSLVKVIVCRLEGLHRKADPRLMEGCHHRPTVHLRDMPRSYRTELSPRNGPQRPCRVSRSQLIELRPDPILAAATLSLYSDDHTRF